MYPSAAPAEVGICRLKSVSHCSFLHSQALLQTAKGSVGPSWLRNRGWSCFEARKRFLTLTSLSMENFASLFAPSVGTQGWVSIQVRNAVFFHHSSLASDSRWPQMTPLFYLLCFFVLCWQTLSLAPEDWLSLEKRLRVYGGET